MDDLNELEVQIKDLDNAGDDVIRAMNNLNGVDGLDEEYTQLDIILDAIREKRSELERTLERLEEEAEYEENKDIWRREQREQEYQYWKTQF